MLLSLLALPLPGRAQSADRLLQEAVARRIRVQEKIEAIGLRVQTESYSRDLVDSFLAVFEERSASTARTCSSSTRCCATACPKD